MKCIGLCGVKNVDLKLGEYKVSNQGKKNQGTVWSTTEWVVQCDGDNMKWSNVDRGAKQTFEEMVEETFSSVL